jgi:hypothetical protein
VEFAAVPREVIVTELVDGDYQDQFRFLGRRRKQTSRRQQAQQDLLHRFATQGITPVWLSRYKAALAAAVGA